MLGSDEIKTMIAALGCGIGQEDFELAKLRYHRIIIMTDADVDGSHIRTLLLTFFYRQLPALVENGYVYIAQPPLFRVKRGKGETYIKDERELETWLIRRATESRTLRLLKSNSEVSGTDLEKLLHRLLTFRKYVQVVERRGYSLDVVKALLDRQAKDKTFFGNKDGLDALADQLSGPTRTVTVQADEEHNLFSLSVEDRSNGYPRHYTIGLDFVTSGEYRTLAGSYGDIHRLEGPMVVVTQPGAAAAHDGEDGEVASARADNTAIGGGELDRPTKLAAEPKDDEPAAIRKAAKKETDVPIASIEELLEFFITVGKRGVTINRYKGLGEMNPEQLWETTMKPETRTLLQVRAEDHTEADLMFTTLMGDQVEPRRKFIEENALNVRNLDI
jgi:DNA gyrase subunit B